MKRIVFCLLLGIGGWSYGQTPPGEQENTPVDQDEAVTPCVSADEAGSGDGSTAAVDPDAPPCDETEFIPEASAEEEFKPGTEISEDYPIPLPSDI